MEENPYRAPETPQESAHSGPPVKAVTTTIQKIGTAILLVGVIVEAYGAVAFFINTSLPPNGGASSRLPSLYVLFVGMGAMLLGVIVRGIRIGVAKSKK